MKLQKNGFLFALLMVFTLLLSACLDRAGNGERPAAELNGTTPPQATGLPAATPDPTGPPGPTETPSESTDTPAPPGTSEPGPAGEPQALWSLELKQAIAAAIDREAIIDRVFESRSAPAYHTIPPASPFFQEPFLVEYGTRDLDRAVSLLTALGYSEEHPFELDFWYPTIDENGIFQVVQIIQEQLEDTGLINIHLKPAGWETFLAQIAAGEMPFFIAGWLPDFMDPENWLAPFASCQQSPLLGIHYCNPSMDELLIQGTDVFNPDFRENVYEEAGILLAVESPVLPLFWQSEFLAYRSGIQGIEISPDFELNYARLSFDENAAPASGSRDTLIIGTTALPEMLDPQAATKPHDIELLKNVGLPLMRMTFGEVFPQPYAAIEQPRIEDGGRTYIFTLREGLQFASGQPLTAQHYALAWERLEAMDNEYYAAYQPYIDSVEALDDETVVYRLTGPSSFFPALAAAAPLMPANPDLYPAGAEASAPGRLDGGGAYQAVSFSPGEELVLEANPNYPGDASPLIPTIVIRYYEDPAFLSSDLENGVVDIAWRSLGLLEAFRLESVQGISVDEVSTPQLSYLIFNHAYLSSAE
jgi:peptide/nickel transport system substrate-binding protein